MRTIVINPALNGYICQVGCQQLVFPSQETLLAALSSYLRNPEEVEKIFLANAVNPTVPVPETTSVPARMLVANDNATQRAIAHFPSTNR